MAAALCRSVCDREPNLKTHVSHCCVLEAETQAQQFKFTETETECQLINILSVYWGNKINWWDVVAKRWTHIEQI